jgi:hypothetical protein
MNTLIHAKEFHKVGQFFTREIWSSNYLSFKKWAGVLFSFTCLNILNVVFDLQVYYEHKLTMFVTSDFVSKITSFSAVSM